MYNLYSSNLFSAVFAADRRTPNVITLDFERIKEFIGFVAMCFYFLFPSTHL